MNFKHISIILCILLFQLIGNTQNHHVRFATIDVQHYVFEIHLNDSTNRIEGKTSVCVEFLRATENCIFDLINESGENKGMLVKSVKLDNKLLNYSHKNNQLKIELIKKAKVGEILEFEIRYTGVPADGLVISKNQHGKRTFFGDNWPDRAKHWLPCVDHPSDKATLEFKVYAPEHYKVVSNGERIEESLLHKHTKLTHWKENVPISTKLMVIGVADFQIGNKTAYADIPVSSWIFANDTATGFTNYKFGTEALAYFSKLIGPYSYEKLAHVQSKTRYGGMENASCIFYHERTATSKQSQERLFAHEVAHQWFGNSVTEQNWHHLWLSEGFATYLTLVYKQHFHGEQEFLQGLKTDREKVIRYSKRANTPIIDTTVTEYIRLLNTNSYQKASWFLHMLRTKLGDDVFFNGLQKYYSDFRNSTALTKDFQNTMEKVSGKDLELFFKQWLWQKGHPVLKTTINDNQITIEQIQKNTSFSYPLELKITFENGTSEIKTINFANNKKQQYISTKKSPKIKSLVLDPNTKLLFETAEKLN